MGRALAACDRRPRRLRAVSRGGGPVPGNPTRALRGRGAADRAERPPLRGGRGGVPSTGPGAGPGLGAPALRPRSGVRGAERVVLPAGGAPPPRARPAHADPVGRPPRAAGRVAHGVDLPPPAGRRVRARVRFHGGADHRPRGTPGHPAGTRVPRCRRRALRPDPLCAGSDAVLVRRERWSLAGPVHSGDRVLAAAHVRLHSAARLVRRLGALPVAGLRRPGVLLVPVGRAPARGGFPVAVRGALALALAPAPRSAAFARRAVAGALAAVPAGVLVGGGEAHQRRSHLAQPDRAHLALPDPAAAALDGLVRAPVAGLVPEALGRRDVRDRGAPAVPDRRATAR